MYMYMYNSRHTCIIVNTLFSCTCTCIIVDINYNLVIHVLVSSVLHVAHRAHDFPCIIVNIIII